MNNNRLQYETMLEHYLLCFNHIVAFRKANIPPLNRYWKFRSLKK